MGRDLYSGKGTCTCRDPRNFDCWDARASSIVDTVQSEEEGGFPWELGTGKIVKSPDVRNNASYLHFLLGHSLTLLPPRKYENKGILTLCWRPRILAFLCLLTFLLFAV